MTGSEIAYMLIHSDPLLRMDMYFETADIAWRNGIRPDSWLYTLIYNGWLKKSDLVMFYR